MMDGLHEEGEDWARLLAYITGLVNQEALLQNEYTLLRSGFCERACLHDCDCPFPNARHWHKSARGWDSRLWSRMLLSRNRIPFSRGPAAHRSEVRRLDTARTERQHSSHLF